ncbi:MAG: class flavin-dependent oxidoreductase [Belnapia sp.]|nr:class flavin-dependent oxidoreductase [Belnapia sp.]
MTQQRRMKLVAYLKTGPTANHAGGWRHPGADLHDILDPARYEHLARVLEAACFDGCFFADAFGIPDIHRGSFRPYVELGGQISYLDPMLVLPLMARVTRHLGLGATLSTTFHPPYLLARMLSTLDHLSGGRACWNIVTSATEFEARNFGMTLPPKDQRYDQADEVLEACCALWDCWAPDALVLDAAAGRFADADRIRYADYAGRYVTTRGPLAMPRSPQGRPVFLQAGASPRGRAFAARWAEAVFCASHGKAETLAFYADMKARVAAAGRVPEDCAILPALSVVLGETAAIAREKAAHLQSLVNPDLTLATNSTMLGADLSRHTTPEALAAAQGHQGIKGTEDRVLQLMKAEGISFAEAASRPRGLVVGTAATVADHMEDLFRDGGCDGFVLSPTVSPLMFEEFGRLVVPELQRRGLFRSAYAGSTLRENLRER